jgi:PmbA protein
MVRESGKAASGHETFCSEESSISLTFSSGETKSKEQSSEKGYGIRVLKAGRLGFAYCESEADMGKARELAASLSAYSPKTGFSFAPKAAYPALNLVDRKISGLDASQMKAMLGQILQGAQKHVRKPRVMLSAGTEKVSLENSEGFSGSYSSSAFSAYVEAMDKDGYGFSYFEGLSLPEDPEGLGEKAGAMAKAMKGAKKLRPGLYDVIFELTALEDVLSVLFPSLSGDWKRKRTSLLAGKAGQQVFNPAISISDDPLARASGARPFDDEGTVSVRMPLIERGVVRNFIYDRETAALEGVDASGFCSRQGFSSPPGAGRSNTDIAAGDCSDLEDELGSCVVVHALHGAHTANTTTGDFGLEVNVAFHRPGKKAEPVPVRGFLISGNIFKLLNGQLTLEKSREAVGNMIAPRIAFRGVQVIS